MEKLTLIIPIPKIIMSVVLWFVLRHRKKHYGYTFRRIKLTHGKYAIVDVEDYGKLAQEDWHLWESGSYNQYAIRYEEGKSLKMHRVIMNAPAGFVVDHKNGNGLDNRKTNLRITTQAQNQYNRKKYKGKTTSQYKGVHRKHDRKKYIAKIRYNNKTIHLGSFEDEIEAAKAYDEAAKKYFGEFARLNFPQVLAKTDGEFAKLNFGQPQRLKDTKSLGLYSIICNLPSVIYLLRRWEWRRFLPGLKT